MPDYRLGRLKGQFVVVWEEAGRRRRYRLGTRDPREARSTLREFVKEQDRIGRPDTGRTVAEIWADYVAEKQAEGKVSAPRMADAWKRLAPHYANLDALSVSGDTTRDYIRDRRKSGAGDGTIHTELGYLRAALRKTLKQNAPALVLPSKPRPKSRYLTPSEARRLIDAAQMPHVRLFLLLALHTAGRPSSILDLEWSRVDSLRGVIHLDNPGRDRTAKGRSSVPLPSVLVEPLKRAREAGLTTHVIEWAGKPVKSIKKATQRAAERAGIEGVTPYVLRHTSAVWMAEAGVPMSEIAQYLGHTSTGVTERTYARYSPQYLRRASDAISATLSTGDTSRDEPDAVNRAGTKKARKVNSKNKKRPKR